MSKKPQTKDPLFNLKQDLDKANNFVDYFIVCGVKPSICLNDSLYEIDLSDSKPTIDLQPEILTKCPSFDKSLVNIDEGILTYCFLSKFGIVHSSGKPKDQLFSFILDNNFFSIEYPQKYVTCLCFYEPLEKYRQLKEKIIKSKEDNNKTNDRSTEMLSQSVVINDMDRMTEYTSEFRSSTIFSLNNSNAKFKRLYIPKAICLVSIYPFISNHRKILQTIYKYSSISKQTKPIEKMILNLIIEIPVPPRGVYSVEYQLCNEEMSLRRKEFNKLPSVDFDIDIICAVLNSEQILAVFNHLLLETKIIFFSFRINSLFNMILGFLQLLYPFKYPFQVASYVQQQNFAIIESISPYILGINQSYTDDFFTVNNIEISEMSILIVDIDRNSIVLKSTEVFPQLPKSFAFKLDKDVQGQIALLKDMKKEKKSSSSSASFAEGFCACFFRFIGNIMKNYSKYLNTDYYTSNDNIQNTNIGTLFKGVEFIQSFSSCDQPFIEKFVNEAQMFSDFIYKRMIPKDNKEKLEILFLDESISDNRRTIFSKKENVFTNSDVYEIKNNYVSLKAQELNSAELNNLLNEENRFKSLEYGQNITLSHSNDKCSAMFTYILFPMFNNEIFCNEKSLSDYNLPPSLIEEVEAINTDIVSKSNLSTIKVQNLEMENYIYLNWLQLWAFSFGYLDDREEDYRYEQMLVILDKVTHHEIEVFNLIFEALKKKEKTQMIIGLYQKLIIFKINPSSYIYSIIYKLVDKNQIKSLTVNPNCQTTTKQNNAKQYRRERTFKNNSEEGVIGERVKFYTNFICIQCQSVINLEKISKDFVNMKRDIMWAFCIECKEYILPKLRIRFGVEYNITLTLEGQTSTVEEVVLHSPYYLKVNVKEAIFREYGILLDVDEFKKKFTALFWDSIWYFHVIALDYSFMIPYVKNAPKQLRALRKVKRIKYVSEMKKVKEPIRRERFPQSELEVSTSNEDTSFELTNLIINVIGSIRSGVVEEKESLFVSQTINILDNTLLPSDTASKLSDDDFEIIDMFKLKRDSLILGKIEEETEDITPLTMRKGIEMIKEKRDNGKDFEIEFDNPIIKHCSITYCSTENNNTHNEDEGKDKEKKENEGKDKEMKEDEPKDKDKEMKENEPKDKEMKENEPKDKDMEMKEEEEPKDKEKEMKEDEQKQTDKENEVNTKDDNNDE